MLKASIKYSCENCGRTYTAVKKNKIILCEKCKTELNRDKQKNKYIPKAQKENYFYKKSLRNKEIAKLFDHGEKIVAIAKIYNLSSTRIRQILQSRDKNVWNL